MRLRRQCAWCKRVEDAGDPGAETTHSICDACFPRWMAEAGLPMQVNTHQGTSNVRIYP